MQHNGDVFITSDAIAELSHRICEIYDFDPEDYYYINPRCAGFPNPFLFIFQFIVSAIDPYYFQSMKYGWVIQNVIRQLIRIIADPYNWVLDSVYCPTITHKQAFSMLVRPSDEDLYRDFL